MKDKTGAIVITFLCVNCLYLFVVPILMFTHFEMSLLVGVGYPVSLALWTEIERRLTSTKN